MEKISLKLGKVYETEDGEQIIFICRNLENYYIGFRFFFEENQLHLYCNTYHQDGMVVEGVFKGQHTKNIVREIKD